VVLAALAWAAPASAKGVTGGTIEGEGIDATISAPSDLSVDAGVYELIWESSDSARLDAAPAADLGPRFTITWLLMGPNGDVPIVQDVYPYAVGGPVTHIEPGQPMWEDARTLGGWATVSERFVTRLEALGVSRPAPPVPSGGTARAPIGASVAAMVLLGIGLALVARRRGEVAPAAG
jgi:hypothetical protein